MKAKAFRKLIRRLAKAKKIQYTTALNELKELPEGVSWKGYVERVERARESDALLDMGE